MEPTSQLGSVERTGVVPEDAFSTKKASEYELKPQDEIFTSMLPVRATTCLQVDCRRLTKIQACGLGDGGKGGRLIGMEENGVH